MRAPAKVNDLFAFNCTFKCRGHYTTWIRYAPDAETATRQFSDVLRDEIPAAKVVEVERYTA